MVEMMVTDFPAPGGTRRVSLRTSNYRMFDLRFALDLRRHFPAIWALGDGLVEEERFEALIPIQRRGGSVRNAAEEAAVRRREAWAARHAENADLADIVAQIRWLVIGRLGIDRMKAMVNDAKEGQAARTDGPSDATASMRG